MSYRILGKISKREVIAKGSSVVERRRLSRIYGGGQWKKMKGLCSIEMENGEVFYVEIHWFEPHGIGKKEVKIKRFL